MSVSLFDIKQNVYSDIKREQLQLLPVEPGERPGKKGGCEREAGDNEKAINDLSGGLQCSMLVKALESRFMEKRLNKQKVLVEEDGFTDDTTAIAQGYVRDYPSVFRLIQKKYAAVRESPKIFHYAGPDKLWHQLYNHFAEKFWFYLEKCDYYEVVLQDLSVPLAGTN